MIENLGGVASKTLTKMKNAFNGLIGRLDRHDWEKKWAWGYFSRNGQNWKANIQKILKKKKSKDYVTTENM